MELCEFNIWWALLNLALDDVDLPVLIGKQLLLADDLFVFLFIFSFDLSEDCVVLFFLNSCTAFLHTLKLFIKFCLFFTACFLELRFFFGKATFLFNQGRNNNNLMFFDSTLINLGFVSFNFSINFSNFFLILTFGVIKLFNFTFKVLNHLS